jgi:outer membrane protein TolC
MISRGTSGERLPHRQILQQSGTNLMDDYRRGILRQRNPYWLWGLAARGLRVLIVTCCCAACALVPACTRRQYRLEADHEVAQIINEKSSDPRWALPPNFNIAMDPRSRYYEPYDEDCPPMPPDDPAAHQYMHYVAGRKGWPYWHRFGDRWTLENDRWRSLLHQYVELTPDGKVVLNPDSALRLARIHSPSYQTQLETLYLSALDVSTERFRLSTQFFGTNTNAYTHSGALRSLAGERNTLQTDSTFTLRRRFATAGELLVGFANSFVWQFTGNDTDNTTSILNFSLVQPLLRSAGQDIALEQLTIVERGLLANLRSFERYRQGFYTQVMIGELGVAAPTRRGGFFGGTGLTGFTGQGAGGLGGVGEVTGFGRGGFAGGGGGGGGGVTGFAGGGAGAVGGYLGLLQQLQQIRNNQDTLNLQLRTLGLLEANLQAGIIDLTQVDQFRQNIETERANLLQSQIALENAIEVYLMGTLGLPPNLPVELDDEMIRQFQFIDPRNTALQNDIADVQAAVGDLGEEPPLASLRAALERLQGMIGRTAEQFQIMDQDVERMRRQIQLRKKTLTTQEQELLDRDTQQLEETLAELRQRFDTLQNAPREMMETLREENRRQTAAGLVNWIGDFYRLVQEMSLVQARARVESVVVEPIELSYEDALKIALAHRLDLMNARASLVDTWRLISFNADALQAGLNVSFSGDVRTERDNMFSFHGKTGTLRAQVQFDAPFTRLLERNNYRQALIDYQRDRRQFIQTVDSVHQSLRQTLRQLRQLRVNLEIQRRAVAISIRRVDLTREDLNRPVPPPQPGQPASQLGPTAALNLLTALSDLRSTQNNFMSVWLNYYAQRMRLMRDLGIMKLDEEGRWIDEPWDSLDRDSIEEIPIPPPIPSDWLEKYGVPHDANDLPHDASDMYDGSDARGTDIPEEQLPNYPPAPAVHLDEPPDGSTHVRNAPRQETARLQPTRYDDSRVETSEATPAVVPSARRRLR